MQSGCWCRGRVRPGAAVDVCTMAAKPVMYLCFCRQLLPKQGSRMEEEGPSPPSAPAQQNNQHQHLPQTLPDDKQNFIMAALWNSYNSFRSSLLPSCYCEAFQNVIALTCFSHRIAIIIIIRNIVVVSLVLLPQGASMPGKSL